MSEKKSAPASEKHATIINNTLAIRTIKPSADQDLVVLKPGANVVKPEIAALIKAHPIIKLEIDNGNIEIAGEHEAGGEKKILAGMKPKEAKDIVSKTTDIPLLQGWLKEEKRKEIKEAIEEQLKELAAPTVYRDQNLGADAGASAQ